MSFEAGGKVAFLKKPYRSNLKMESQGHRVELVRSTSFGRKRVALSSVCGIEFGDNEDCILSKPLKRQCSLDSFYSADKSLLEDLPQEILIKILCGVEHDDLKRLFFVSKTMREATSIAKQTHFAYSTPRKTLKFPNAEDLIDFSNLEAPNAPRQSRVPRFRLSEKKLSDISVALFGSGGEARWPKRDFIGEIEEMES